MRRWAMRSSERSANSRSFARSSSAKSASATMDFWHFPRRRLSRRLRSGRWSPPTAACLGWKTSLGSKNLALDGQGLTDEAVRHLAGLTALESLTLNDGKVTGSGFSALDTLAHFTSLSITNCPIDDRGCQSLASLHHLESLELTGTQITDRALVSIAKLFLIKTLKLTDAGLTPAGLAKLSPLKELKDLTVANLSEEGLAEVRAALPGAQVNPAGPINGWWTVTGVETLYEARPTDPDDQATDPANNPGNPIGAEGGASQADEVEPWQAVSPEPGQGRARRGPAA